MLELLTYLSLHLTSDPACLSPCSADVNPEHHVKIMEALIAAGGLVEMQAAPGRTDLQYPSSSLCANMVEGHGLIQVLCHKWVQMFYTVHCF